jgi:glycosyltransferase involved in cell wall biosynthesis
LNKKYNHDISFILIGKDHLFPKIDLNKIAVESGVQDNFIWLNYVSDLELSQFYKISDCFICASVCEGFNITPLEAMQLGVPLVTSRLSSIPEVVGDSACIMDNPRDPVEQSICMEKVLFDSDYASRLRQLGFIQAKKFSWEKCWRQYWRKCQILFQKAVFG